MTLKSMNQFADHRLQQKWFHCHPYFPHCPDLRVMNERVCERAVLMEAFSVHASVVPSKFGWNGCHSHRFLQLEKPSLKATEAESWTTKDDLSVQLSVRGLYSFNKVVLPEVFSISRSPMKFHLQNFWRNS